MAIGDLVNRSWPCLALWVLAGLSAGLDRQATRRLVRPCSLVVAKYERSGASQRGSCYGPSSIAVACRIELDRKAQAREPQSHAVRELTCGHPLELGVSTRVRDGYLKIPTTDGAELTNVVPE
jgi:hypothetical protein